MLPLSAAMPIWLELQPMDNVPGLAGNGEALVRQRDRDRAARAGETDEEIARVTGYTVPMIRAVLRSG